MGHIFKFKVKKRWQFSRLVRIGALAAVIFPAAMRVDAQSTSPVFATPHENNPGKDLQSAPAAQTFTLIGAGDIATCNHLQSAYATAKLIERIPGTVFAAGDLAYERGIAKEFKNCYDPSWGRFKDRTKPALGNHEYARHSATGYFEYWGEQAGPPDQGFYSYDLGSWHIVVLNTNCFEKGVGGCGTDSPQESWLKGDLAKHPDACILAYGHHPLNSSGVKKKHAMHPELRPLWEDLYAAHADVVLAGHEHFYERVAPQDPQGNPDPARGIRQIIVGTGGRQHDEIGTPIRNSEVREAGTYGVLKLTLAPGKYNWEFLPAEGQTFRDSGSGVCHNAPPSAE